MRAGAKARAAVAAVLLGAAVSLLPVGSPAGANHLCKSRTIDIPGPNGTLFYIQDRNEGGDGDAVPIGLIGGEGTWIYMEDNDTPKLQPWGAWPPPADINTDPCPAGNGPPDLLII